MSSLLCPLHLIVVCCHCGSTTVVHRRRLPAPILPGSANCGSTPCPRIGRESWLASLRESDGGLNPIGHAFHRPIDQRADHARSTSNVLPRYACQHALPARSTQTRPTRNPAIPRPTKRTPQCPHSQPPPNAPPKTQSFDSVAARRSDTKKEARRRTICRSAREKVRTRAGRQQSSVRRTKVVEGTAAVGCLWKKNRENGGGTNGLYTRDF